jgi:hypothetical protein
MILVTSTIEEELLRSSLVNSVSTARCPALHSFGTLTFYSVDIVDLLDIKILPYVIFLVVPVLGRMSDSDDEVRLVATNTFATLIKLVPLEVSCRIRSIAFTFLILDFMERLGWIT